MIRRYLAALSCLALGSLSRGQFPLAPLSSPRALPPVSLEPPPASAPEIAIDPRVEQVRGYLADRRTGLSEAEVQRVAEVIVRESERRSLDPILVMAVIHIESRGNAFAVSPVGAMGMMQIMPPTGEDLAEQLGIRWLGPQTLFDPVANVQMGIAYLEHLATRYGNMKTALAAYNWGPGRIDSRLRRGDALPAVYSGSVLATYRGR